MLEVGSQSPGLTSTDRPETAPEAKTADEPGPIQLVAVEPAESEAEDEAGAEAASDGTPSKGAKVAPAIRRSKRVTRPVVPPKRQIAESSEAPRLSEAAAEDFGDDTLRLTDLFADLSDD